MKKAGLAFLLLILVFSGCRKGEDDPFISLRSRTNRLCGKWRLTEYNKLVFLGTDKWSYDTYELQLNGGQGVLYYRGSILDQYSLIEYWHFHKDGTFLIETNASNTMTFQEGTWAWNGKNKNSEYKKKGCVLMKVLKYDHNNGEEVSEFSGATLDPTFVIAIKKLTDKEISFSIDESFYIKDEGYQRIQTKATLIKEDE